MALADLTSTKAAMHGAPCSIGEVYRRVADDPSELAGLNRLLYDLGASERAIYDELTKEGFKVGAQTPNKHRGGRCRCWQETPLRFCRTCRHDLGSCRCDA